MTYDVIVAGLGAMGSATAYHLAARGVRVLGLDQYAPPHTLGSSHGESRIIREAYYEHPLYVPLVQRAYTLWERLAQDAGSPGLMTVTGGLMLGHAESGLISGVRRSAQEHNLAVVELSPRALQERYPQFMPMSGFQAVLDPRAGVLDPEACIRAHLSLAEGHGATLKVNETVLQWSLHGDGVRVRTSRGTYDAGRLVIAAGPWMKELLGAIGPELNVERQTLVWFDPPGERAQWQASQFPIFMCEFPDGQLIYGFPMGPRGWKAAVHYEGEPVEQVQHMRRDTLPHDITRVRSAVSRLFPWVQEAPILDSASCPYTDTLDLRFTIDFLPGIPQVLVSSPCSGHGFKFASAIGEAQAQLLIDGRSTFDLSPFRIDR